jgi:transcriptional regulator with XRE-family HTH domain
MKEPRSRASEHVGELVRDLRHKATLSRNKLAQLADMDVSHLARIENGQGNPTLFVIVQLATALKVKPELFVKDLTADDLPADVRPYSLADFLKEKRQRGGV